MIIDAAGERSEQGRFLSNRSDSGNVGLARKARVTSTRIRLFFENPGNLSLEFDLNQRLLGKHLRGQRAPRCEEHSKIRRECDEWPFDWSFIDERVANNASDRVKPARVVPCSPAFTGPQFVDLGLAIRRNAEVREELSERVSIRLLAGGREVAAVETAADFGRSMWHAAKRVRGPLGIAFNHPSRQCDVS